MRLFFSKHYKHYPLIVSAPINAATWAITFIAYAGNRLRYRKKNRHLPSITNALVVGDEATLSEVSKLLAENAPGGKHTFVQGTEDTRPEGHLSAGVNLKNYDTVVYDTEHYTYTTILRLLKQTPQNTLRIATYSPKTKLLITDRKIYRHK